MINYIGIDYINKFKVDMNEKAVQRFCNTTKTWNSLESTKIISNYSTLKDMSILTFEYNNYVYEVNVSSKYDIVLVSVYNKINYSSNYIESANYTYSLDDPDSLFVLDVNKQPVLNKNNFYSITEEDINGLANLDANRVIYLLKVLNNDIKTNVCNELIIARYMKLLANLIYKDNPLVEEIFNNNNGCDYNVK